MVEFKDFSRPFSVFHVLFKANLIFKDFTRQSCIFKYFSSLCEPCSRQQIVWYFSFLGGGGNGVGEVIRLDISCVSSAADFILDTSTPVLWQTKMIQMKCCIRWNFIRVCTNC